MPAESCKGAMDSACAEYFVLDGLSLLFCKQSEPDA